MSFRTEVIKTEHIHEKYIGTIPCQSQNIHGSIYIFFIYKLTARKNLVRSHRRRHLRAEWAVLAQRLIEGAAPPAQFVIVQQLAWRHLTTGPLSTVINFVRCRHCCTWRTVRVLQNVAIMRQNNLLKMVIP